MADPSPAALVEGAKSDSPAKPTNAPPLMPMQMELSPWRRRLLLISLFIGCFLSFLDTTIVSVALPTIANHFDDFDHSTWVLTAYLLTYMAFGIIISRLSDIFGRMIVEIVCLSVFLIFSLACAVSQSMIQLIIFRALQGIGGSGIFSMTIVIGINAVSAKGRGAFSGFIGITTAMAGVLGPVLSGAITQNRNASTWRWIFYLNLPVGGLALLLFVLSWPRATKQARQSRAFASVDFLGALLLLAASTLLIFALQEGGAYVYAWSSGTIIASLVVSGVAFIAFVVWQEYLGRHPKFVVQQVFPTSVMKQRPVAGITMVTLLAGFTYYTAIVNLPQRFQIVDGSSPLISGVKMIPMLVSAGIGSASAGSVNARRNFTTYTLMISTATQMLGYGLMTTFGESATTPNSVYGFEIFLGLGFGFAISTVTIAIQISVEPRWIAVTQGCLTQMRSLGGSLGLAASVIIVNRALQTSSVLAKVLTPAQSSALYKSPLVIATLDPLQQKLVAGVYASAFTQQMRVSLYISAAAFVMSLLTWQRNPPPSPIQAQQAMIAAAKAPKGQEQGEKVVDNV